MAAERSYARLGLFVVVGLAVVLATMLFFIQRFRSREVIRMVTYVDESVTGLDISSPVRLRGVPVGRVSNIRIDPSRRLIEVDFEVFHDRLATIGADVRRVQDVGDLPVFPKLRTQVIGNAVTGEAYLLLDVPADPPPAIPLGFTPPLPYVASMPSPLETIKDRLPELLEHAEATLLTLREIVARIPDSLDRSDRFFTNVEQILRASDLPQLSADLQAFSKASTTEIAQMRVDAKEFFKASETLVQFAEEARSAIRDADVANSSKAARDASDRTSLAADDLRRMLPAFRDSLEMLRDLARRLEEQPESVVYGPRKTKGGKLP
jgi:paraquat-inducible protein B